MFYLKRIVFVFFLFTSVGVTFADQEPTRVALVTNKSYNKHATKLSEHLKESKNIDADIIFARYDFEVCSQSNNLEGYDLIVSLGRRGLQMAICSQINKERTPIYSILISKSHYKSMLAKYNSYFDKDIYISAFYIDQEIYKHVGFLKAISKYMDEPLRAGVILGNSTKYSKEELIESAKHLDVKLDVYELEDNEEPATALKRILENHNLILALPDYGVFDKHNARGMLMLAFANKVPVVGYTKATTEGGGLASLYSPRYKQVKEAAVIIDEILSADKLVLPKDRHPSDFSIAVNSTVKKRLVPQLAHSSELYELLLQDLANE